MNGGTPDRLNGVLTGPDHTFHAVGTGTDFEVLWQGTPVAGHVCGSFTMTHARLRDRLDNCLRQMVHEHAKSKDVDTRIDQMLDRVLDLALKDFERTLRQGLNTKLIDDVMRRARAKLDAIPLKLELSFDVPPATAVVPVPTPTPLIDPAPKTGA